MHTRWRIWNGAGPDIRTVWVDITTAAGVIWRGSIRAFANDGIQVRFAGRDVPDLAPGSSLHLRVGAAGRDDVFPAEAQVELCDRSPEATRYNFRFLDGERFHRSLPLPLQTMFAPRGAFRVVPRAEAPIAVVVMLPGRENGFPTTIRSISATGLAFDLDAEADARLRPLDRVVVRLTLPDRHEPLQIAATIRTRKNLERGGRYGLSFDARRTEQFARVERAITDYVMQRQREPVRT